jgi:hypothetical protein
MRPGSSTPVSAICRACWILSTAHSTEKTTCTRFKPLPPALTIDLYAQELSRHHLMQACPTLIFRPERDGGNQPGVVHRTTCTGELRHVLQVGCIGILGWVGWNLLGELVPAETQDTARSIFRRLMTADIGNSKRLACAPKKRVTVREVMRCTWLHEHAPLVDSDPKTRSVDP